MSRKRGDGVPEPTKKGGPNAAPADKAAYTGTRTESGKIMVEIGQNDQVEADLMANFIAEATGRDDGRFRLMHTGDEGNRSLWYGTSDGAGHVDAPTMEYIVGLYIESGHAALVGPQGAKEWVFQSHPPTRRLSEIVRFRLKDLVPPINGVLRHPFVHNGAMVSLSHRYHEPTGIWCLSPEGVRTDLPLDDAKSVISEFFGDFAFDTEIDRTNGLSPLLGAPLKLLGIQPLSMYDKPGTRTGASKLAQSIAWILTGRGPELITFGKKDDPENDKALITKLKTFPDAILIDNLDHTLGSRKLAAGLTNTTIGGRLLNLNEDVKVATKSISFFVTGNNLSASDDLTKRSVYTRLDAHRPDPENRRGFRHKLPLDVMDPDARLRILSAVCSICQSWLKSGAKQDGDRVQGGFDEYMAPVAGLLAHAGYDGYNDNRAQADAAATPERLLWSDFYSAWWKDHAGERDGVQQTPMATADTLLELAKTHLEDGELTTSKLSYALRSRRKQRTTLPDHGVTVLLENIREGSGRRGWVLKATG